MRVLLTGFIREERGDYADEEKLIADIKLDCDVARNSLNCEARDGQGYAGWELVGT